MTGARHRPPGCGAGAGCRGRTPLSRALLAPRGRVPTHFGEAGRDAKPSACVCPPPEYPESHRPWRGGEGARGARSQVPADSKPALAPCPSPPPCEHRIALFEPPRTPRPLLVTDSCGGPQHREAADPSTHHPITARAPRVAPAPWRDDAPASTLPPGGPGDPAPSPPARTWFMTLPKSIRGLACLHPRGTAPQPHLARGARGAAGGAAGGRREPGVARAGRSEGRLQAEPPSLPGPSLEKEGRKEGGRREGREGGGEPKGFAPQKRDPGDGGARGGPAGSPLPSAPPGRPGAGEPGAPAPALGRNGVPVDFFHRSSPFSRFFSLFLLLFPLLSCTARSKSGPAPLPSPPPKTPLKATGSLTRAAGPGVRVPAGGQTTPPPPKKKIIPPTPRPPPPPKALAAGAEGPRRAAGCSGVGALSPRVTPPASRCPWRGGGGRDRVGPCLGPARHPLAQLGAPLPYAGPSAQLMVLGCPTPPALERM